jgi:hypothetical protein
MNIFLSHGHVNTRQSRTFAELLRSYGGGNLEVYRSEEIPPGMTWFDHIVKAVKGCDVLVFLLFGDEPNLDWCNFEAGLCAGCSSDKRIVVLHPEGVIAPRPLQQYQNVSVSAHAIEPVETFIWSLFQCDTDPINPEVCKRRGAYETVKNGIIDLFKKPQKPPAIEEVSTELDWRIVVRFNKAQFGELYNKAIIDPEVEVCGHHSSLTIFGFQPPFNIVSWGELLNRLDEVERGTQMEGVATVWAEHLGKLLRVAATNWEERDGVRLADGLPFYRDLHHNITYRPSLYEITRRGDEEAKFKLNFTKLPSELAARPGGRWKVISHMLDLCRLFRFGVLENPEFAVLVNPSDEPIPNVERILDKLDVALSNVRSDFLNRGIPLHEIPRAFASGNLLYNHAGEIKHLLAEGKKIRTSISRAIAKRDLVEVRRCLYAYSRMNVEFYTICAKHTNRNAQKLKPLGE